MNHDELRSLLRADDDKLGHNDLFPLPADEGGRAAPMLTRLDLERILWDCLHRRCIRYTEGGAVRECLSCGSVRP